MNENNGLTLKYFVLNPTTGTPYGAASRAALAAYASRIYDTNPILANDLRAWIEHCMEGVLNERYRDSSDTDALAAPPVHPKQRSDDSAKDGATDAT